MKKLFIFLSIALASCGTTATNEFMTSYNQHGRQYGSQIMSRSGIHNTIARSTMSAPRRRVNTNTNGGTMCPNTSGSTILKPATGPLTNPKTFKVDIFNNAVKDASTSSQRTTKRIIIN